MNRGNARPGRTNKQPSPHSYQQRTYRRLAQPGLVASRVQVMETDLHILATDQAENEALRLVTGIRKEIETYIRAHPEFLDALTPLGEDPDAPPSVQAMLAAARKAGVGPMAAVAGTVAEFVGRQLIRTGQQEIIVENGGDIYVHRLQPCTIGVFAGQSPLSGRVGIRLATTQMPCGVCTSSATIGHSLSMGASDAAVVVASSTPLADALATRLGNEVRDGRRDLERALCVARKMEGIMGAVLIVGEQLGAWGDIELVRLELADG